MQKDVVFQKLLVGRSQYTTSKPLIFFFLTFCQLLGILTLLCSEGSNVDGLILKKKTPDKYMKVFGAIRGR